MLRFSSASLLLGSLLLAAPLCAAASRMVASGLRASSASASPNAIFAEENETEHRGVAQTAAPSIVVSQEERHWWGFPNYLADLDSGMMGWAEFARSHGHKGRTCELATTRQRCGDAFVCKAGICAECQMSRDCGEKFLCQAFPGLPGSATTGSSMARRMCIPRDLLAQWNHYEVIATVLIIITAMFSAAAGMGGGGVYVPLLLLLLGLSTQEAVPLSQTMIVGGAVINILMFCGDRHPKFPTRPKIDYDVIMMLNPGMAAGVMIGVMMNVMSPQWLIVGVLILTLVLALQKSYVKGISEWKKESKMLAEQADKGAGAAPKVQIKLVDFKSFYTLAKDNQRQLSLIGGCWIVFLLVNLVKAQQCTPMYWMQVFGMVVMCGAFTQAGARTIVERGVDKDNADGVLPWTPTTLWLYPALATVAGFLGGFLGIGGGIILGPLLLELGMAAEASQATTAMFVFLSSSLATIQFVVMGKGMPAYAVWFTAWVVLATFLGQTIIDYVLKRYQRASLIVLSIAAIIAGSLVMMTAIGVKDVYMDISRGAPMGFMPHMLCNSR